ncbi:elongation factor P maturation arginine rhamnosyltransferase EarP [Pollutimonas sp. H1-120]|uniref:elongation factor P maturation arginine rhamnosyltransferase EarP n=1 Tax=Pollutimonas sp. H1-120 TaxID=3148824 RepID=UPI003B516261
MSSLSFDIFCRVVDNFGDIGVCWRLSRQLAAPPGRYPVRLWVDDLRSFARIEPEVDPKAEQQTVKGVDIVHWTDQPPALAPMDVVIEAFACDPPADFVGRMIGQNSLWINLEYLSAEKWVESCHALPSVQASGLRKAFFFPGFTERTGGLLREPGLLAQRDRWQADPARREELLRLVGLPQAQIDVLHQGARQVLLFSYPDAPAQALLEALQMQNQGAVVLVPSGVCPALERGQHGAVHVHEMPFIDQDGFDRLLWSSDLNCVRGEDSLVRALWAGKPLIWQIYPQDGNAHMIKLEAWLARSQFGPEIRRLMTSWNNGNAEDCLRLLSQALQPPDWTGWQAAAASWAAELAGRKDLAHSLSDFCARQQRKS